jgi:23S rRNA (cytidine2498-2'-O)-methyltransferase
MTWTELPGGLYQPVSGFEDHLAYELGPRRESWGPFFYAAEIPAGPVFWHRNIWLCPRRIEIASISGAARALRDLQRNWAPVLFTQFRRGALIQEQLPALSSRRRPFPWVLPQAPLGAWTLLDAHTLIASPACASPFPGGIIEFEEDKEGPPSRAYLKLWEALVRCRKWPRPGERCLDAGASPGGWTWALARLGAEVIAADRAPLDRRIEALPGVRFIKHDAFTLKPEDIGPLDWLCCDVVCYPVRLLEWLEKWLASGLCRNFICTIKMQGPLDQAGEAAQGFAVARRLGAIPGSTVAHLYHNKHELTWMLTEDPAASSSQ